MTDSAPQIDGRSLWEVVIRMDTKLDLALGQHEVTLKDHESRIRALQDRKTVSPAQLLASSVGVVTLIGGTLAVLDRIYG